MRFEASGGGSLDDVAAARVATNPEVRRCPISDCLWPQPGGFKRAADIVVHYNVEVSERGSVTFQPLQCCLLRRRQVPGVAPVPPLAGSAHAP
jgi:hypothetical protein